VFAWVGFFVPLVWVASPTFRFAEYPLRAVPLAAGVMCYVIGLWLFYRSHDDLGTNWSITLETRGTSTHHAWRLSRGPPPDVLGVGSLFRRPSPRNPKLGGRLSEPGRVRGPLCGSCRCRRENDGPAIWQRIRHIHSTDEASYSPRLVDDAGPANKTVQPTIRAQRSCELQRFVALLAAERWAVSRTEAHFTAREDHEATHDVGDTDARLLPAGAGQRR